MSNKPSRTRKAPSRNGVKQPFQFRRHTYWSDREIFCLALGLQRYGFSEIKKITELIKTKEESAVKHYVSSEVGKIRNNRAKEKCLPIRGSGSWYHPHKEEIKDWPVIRKWRRLMYNQTLPCVRMQNYSKIVMESMLQSFYEEAEEPTGPHVANFKAIYKYLLDCFCGRVPPELLPIDSGIVLLLLGLMTEMERELNFSEEKTFLKTFKKAKSFVPMEIKSEFKEKAKRRSEILGNSLKAKLSHNDKLDPKCIPSTSCSSAVNSEATPGTSQLPKELGTNENISRMVKIKTEPIDSDELSDITAEAFETAPWTSKVKLENGGSSAEVPEVASEITVSTTAEPLAKMPKLEDEDSDNDDIEMEVDSENAVRIPMDIYLNLSKHRKLVQSFNPLNVPMWTLVTEQAIVQNRCEVGLRSEQGFGCKKTKLEP